MDVFGSVAGWFEVAAVERPEAIRLSFALSRPLVRDSISVRILESARAHFRDSTSWSRQDRRTFGFLDCSPTALARSLFCAVYEATRAALGDAYGGPANQAVLDEVRRRRPTDQHPVQAFNNDPTTTLDDVRSVLEAAIGRVRPPEGK